MAVAAFGLLLPAFGALLQEGIDVAVIFNALRALGGVWVPRTLSCHATCTYSWMRPPSRSRRSGRMIAPERGGVSPTGGR